MSLQLHEELFIQNAVAFLDHPNFLIRLANAIGKPLEMAVHSLPARHQKKIRQATQAALQRGLIEVKKTIPTKQKLKKGTPAKRIAATERWHTAASFGVGAAGGFFGLLSLPVELPITTAIILRSVASIAKECGMDLEDPQTQLECLYILSLGSPETDQDDAMASAYWTSRTAFARMSSQAASFIAKKSSQQLAKELHKNASPFLVKFLGRVAARFEVVVSEKVLAEAVPVIGAIGGGVINAAFTNYFSQAARYHFGLRALENKHGRDAVESCYDRMKRPSSDTQWSRQ